VQNWCSVHGLKNTESKTIEGTVFHYNFFVMNGQPTLTSL